jgi:hypothetical protein
MWRILEDLRFEDLKFEGRSRDKSQIQILKSPNVVAKPRLSAISATLAFGGAHDQDERARKTMPRI